MARDGLHSEHTHLVSDDSESPDKSYGGLVDNKPIAQEQGWWKTFLKFSGPGFLMSAAYVDPGNLEADLQCGARFGYQLLWAFLVSTAIGMAFQLIALRLGCVTKQHLAEHCKAHYTFSSRVFLWLAIEVAIIGADIQEVIGCSIGLYLLFGLPLYVGVLVTAAAAFCFLFLENVGIRSLETFFAFLLLMLACCMGHIFFAVEPDLDAVARGLLVARLPSSSALVQVVGLVGCIVMPHNLFLHSALVQSRPVEPNGEKEAIACFSLETVAILLVTVFVNVCVASVFAKGFYGKSEAEYIGLANAGAYLGDSFGPAVRLVWALGLVASGQSSTMAGAYAGQFVMSGFLDLRVVAWKRAVVTRSVALVPCLGVALFTTGGGFDELNGHLNVVQSMVLPFAVVPLLTFAGSPRIMGNFVLSPPLLYLACCLIAVVTVANAVVFGGAINAHGTLEQGTCWLAWLSILLYAIAVLHVALAPHVHAQKMPEVSRDDLTNA